MEGRAAYSDFCFQGRSLSSCSPCVLALFLQHLFWLNVGSPGQGGCSPTTAGTLLLISHRMLWRSCRVFFRAPQTYLANQRATLARRSSTRRCCFEPYSSLLGKPHKPDTWKQCSGCTIALHAPSVRRALSTAAVPWVSLPVRSRSDLT